MTEPQPNPTAAVLIIGNEILSGRTQDANLNYIAKKLTAIGIRLAEARVVPDIESDIVAAVNMLRARYTYVFTTGGIGPTHDDITADSIAKAFEVPITEHPQAREKLEKQYDTVLLNAARLRMARMPANAKLIDNPVSAAPGFCIGNVFVLAGVPSIMQAMMDNVAANLKHGPSIYNMALSAFISESVVAEDLAAIATRYPQLDIGSYPWIRQGKFGTSLVMRGTDEAAVQAAANDIRILIAKHGGAPKVES